MFLFTSGAVMAAPSLINPRIDPRKHKTALMLTVPYTKTQLMASSIKCTGVSGPLIQYLKMFKKFSL